MKVLVVGLGSIGRRHIKNIKAIDRDIQIAVWRQHSKSAELGETGPLVEKVFFIESEALDWAPEAVFVTNPAPMHCKTALLFARRGSHLFIEKPLAADNKGIDELSEECEKQGLILMVGYVLRFLEPLRVMKEVISQGRVGKVLSIKASVGQYLLDWRPAKDYRNTVTARKDLGGGVLLELSHELDYLRWLAGEVTEVQALTATVSGLEIDVEDIAEITLRFSGGAIGSIHLDMLDRALNRSCRVIGSKGTIFWNFDKNSSLSLYSCEEKKWLDLLPEGGIDRDDVYRLELEHFFECIRTGKKPLISGADGKRVLELVAAARLSAEKGEAVKV